MRNLIKKRQQEANRRHGQFDPELERQVFESLLDLVERSVVELEGESAIEFQETLRDLQYTLDFLTSSADFLTYEMQVRVPSGGAESDFSFRQSGLFSDVMNEAVAQYMKIHPDANPNDVTNLHYEKRIQVQVLIQKKNPKDDFIGICVDQKFWGQFFWGEVDKNGHPVWYE